MKKTVLQLTIITALLFFLSKVTGSVQPALSQNVPLTQAEVDPTVQVEKTLSTPSAPAPVTAFLNDEFCQPAICGEAGWQQWIIVSSAQPWQVEELTTVQNLLATVIDALDQQGLDGRSLLSGYRFRRQAGEHIVGHDGRIAVVNHQSREITLADAAFKRLRGFYILHELGHIVDERTDRALTATFHELAGSNLDQTLTAPGFWLNRHAEDDLEEATADAFALWIMTASQDGYRPIFAGTPPTANYDGIVSLLQAAIDSLSI